MDRVLFPAVVPFPHDGLGHNILYKMKFRILPAIVLRLRDNGCDLDCFYGRSAAKHGFCWKEG